MSVLHIYFMSVCWNVRTQCHFFLLFFIVIWCKLREMDTLPMEATLSKLFVSPSEKRVYCKRKECAPLPSEKGCTLKGKNELPFEKGLLWNERMCFPSEKGCILNGKNLLPFEKWCTLKGCTLNRKNVLPFEKGCTLKGKNVLPFWIGFYFERKIFAPPLGAHSFIVEEWLSEAKLSCILHYQDPVVQSVVSLTSSLRVISLTVLADSIYNILIFFAEKMWVAFALQKLLTFFQQKFQHICISLHVNFNESLTNDIVSFEQLGPGCPTEIGLQLGKAGQVKVEGNVFISYVSSLSFIFLSLLSLSFISIFSSVFSLSLGNNTKWPTRVDVSLSPNSINLSL